MMAKSTSVEEEGAARQGLGMQLTVEFVQMLNSRPDELYKFFAGGAVDDCVFTFRNDALGQNCEARGLSDIVKLIDTLPLGDCSAGMLTTPITQPLDNRGVLVIASGRWAQGDEAAKFFVASFCLAPRGDFKEHYYVRNAAIFVLASVDQIASSSQQQIAAVVKVESEQEQEQEQVDVDVQVGDDDEKKDDEKKDDEEEEKKDGEEEKKDEKKNVEKDEKTSGGEEASDEKENVKKDQKEDDDRRARQTPAAPKNYRAVLLAGASKNGAPADAAKVGGAKVSVASNDQASSQPKQQQQQQQEAPKAAVKRAPSTTSGAAVRSGRARAGSGRSASSSSPSSSSSSSSSSRRQSGGGGGKEGGGGRRSSSSRALMTDRDALALYVRNVHPDTTEKELTDLFVEHGQVRSVHIERRKQVAFVNYYKLENVNRALAAAERVRPQLRGHKLTVEPKKPSNRIVRPRGSSGRPSRNANGNASGSS
jgi:RNA recognition motif/Nuclear transport factor 2 (NTF2) domain